MSTDGKVFHPSVGNEDSIVCVEAKVDPIILGMVSFLASYHLPQSTLGSTGVLA